MKKRILEWLFGNSLDEYKDVLHSWTKAINGWGEAIDLATDAIARNEKLIGLTDSLLNRYKSILRNAIVAYEFELEQQDYETEEDLHAVVLNEFGMTDEEYRYIMGVNANEDPINN
jgi:hypothetical protein